MESGERCVRLCFTIGTIPKCLVFLRLLKLQDIKNIDALTCSHGKRAENRKAYDKGPS